MQIELENMIARRKVVFDALDELVKSSRLKEDLQLSSEEVNRRSDLIRTFINFITTRD